LSAGKIKNYLHFSVSKDYKGNGGGFWITEEISKRELLYEELRKSEERYRFAAELTGQLIYDWDFSTGQIVWAGPITKFTGYSTEGYQKCDMHKWIAHVHPEDRKRVVDTHKNCLETGDNFYDEYRFKRKDGSYFYVEDRGIYLKDEKDEICRTVGILRDINEIRLSVENARVSEEQCKSFIKSLNGIAFQLNNDYAIQSIRGAVEEITGYKGDEFVSGDMKWKQIIEPECMPLYYKIAEELKSPNALIEYEYKIRCKDGSVKWLHETIQNVCCDASGKILYIQGSDYDITARKKAEKELSMLKEISKKEIYHRVKNNLQVISSLLDLQADKFEDSNITDALRECQNRVLSMALIHEELYQSALDEKLNFAAYLQNLTNEIFTSYNVGKTDIELKVDLEEVFLGMDTAIPLGIIVNELVSNSLKYAFPSGNRGVVHITLRKKENGAAELKLSGADMYFQNEKSFDYVLTVADSGKGIPEEIDFRNTDSLGLQLVNILVEQIDGFIELNSSKSTEFTIWFNNIEK
jgi:PAS domain S-box-containing protein